MELLSIWMPALGLSMLRPLGMMLMVPLMNPSVLGGTLIRNAVALAIALPALAMYDTWPLPQKIQLNGWNYLWLVATEIGIGVMIGFAAAIPFWALDMAGTLIDTMRGTAMASVINPMIGQESSLLGILLTRIFGVLFLVSGGLNELIATLYHSYASLPPGTAWQLQGDFPTFFMHQWQLLYELCIRFAMPAMVAVLLVDMAFGLINRSAPQMNVFFLSMPVKSAFAIFMLIVSLTYALQAPADWSLRFVDHGYALMERLR
ncbi:type III secretion system export apparatus subunit SctT [Pseudomonas aeruginosa]|uniref:type III secretion system export apparatus subunit SctT n=1 Tax=Pseudomonas aeruginosa TaxID=287 RepID=UPI003D26E34D|nr:type III secretion system export apparatus subunit SctT [Pseudomonas aeruginosa]